VGADRPLRFGCVARDPAESRAAWLERVDRVEQDGYDVLLVPDHLGIWPPFSPLVAAAEVTDRLRFGTQVLNVEFWNPVLLAREAAAVDVLTDGRLELGFGAGHAEDEFSAVGIRYPSGGERVDHLADAVPPRARPVCGRRRAGFR
jgi:alkanesulfonate monooxygenase SsuD/methylene tetrahydromethanopterin reductase-like flavin-dependent oxidoreductase (luciferase family)